MIYLSWAAMYEGSSDASYFDVLIPKVMEHLVLTEGEGASDVPSGAAVRFGAGLRTVEEVAKMACSARDAFHIIFIHADTGGRALEAGIAARSTAYCREMKKVCSWDPRRCVVITPCHETEAWLLADPGAIMSALGYAGAPDRIGLPDDAVQAERLSDPKAVLHKAILLVRGRRRRIATDQIYPAIAQRQSINALRRSASFLEFEQSVRTALADLGSIRRIA